MAAGTADTGRPSGSRTRHRPGRAVQPPITVLAPDLTGLGKPCGDVTQLVNALRDLGGASLRIVATVDALEYEVVYTREELADAYSREALDRAYQAMMANQVSASDFSQATALGDVEAQLFVFEDVLVFLFPASRYDGVFASFDRDEQFPMFDVVDEAERILELHDA